MIDFKVPKSKNCVIIDTKKWVQNSSQILTVHRMSGRDIPTYIAEVLCANIERECLQGAVKEGDKVLLTRVASEVAQYRAFEVEVGDKRYYDVPVMQVLGVFRDGISFSSLDMLFDKILIKRIEDTTAGKLQLPDNNTMIGEVIKVGTCRFDKDWKQQKLRVNTGDRVLIRDNVTTEITLNGETYYATEEGMVVGVFEGNDYSLNSLRLLNDSIIFDSYVAENVLGSSLLTPNMNYENEDITDIYNRDLFKVLASDKSLTKLQKDDIIIVDRSVTNYVYIGTDKYFMLSGMDYIEAKVN